jgi:hypothetical protein
MINWNEIADRFFSFYGETPQTDLITKFESSQTQVSKWKGHHEKIPFKVLEKFVERENVTWDWLLEGRMPQHRDGD